LEKSYKRIGHIIEPYHIAEIVKKALLVRTPKYIYRANPNPTIKLLSLLPQKIIDVLLKKMVRH